MNNEFNMFDDDEIMIFPESIDDIEPTKTSYLFSTTKLILMFIGILPLFILGIMLLSEYGLVPATVFASLYIIIYIYMVRLYVIEEPVQRESLNQLEDNKISDYSYFWDITKIGTSEHDNGLMYLTQDGIALRRAYVVKFDSGSIIGVPEDFLNEFRHTQQAFLRGIGMSVKWYSVQKKPAINESLKNQGKNLVLIENEALNKLIKVQLNSYLRYSRDADQRYVNYIVVINNKFETLSSFKTTLEDVLNRTLRTNSNFKNVEILNKEGIDEFFATYYMQDIMDTGVIRKTSTTKPFSSYARVVNVVDENNLAVDMEVLDIINKEIATYNVGQTFEKIELGYANEELNKEKLRLRQKDMAKKEVTRKRRNNEITFEEYKETLAKIEHDYSEENFIPNRAEFEKKQERERIKQERIQKREEEKQAKIEAERLANTPPPKWFDESQDLEEELKPIDEIKTETNKVNDNFDTDIDIDDFLNNPDFDDEDTDSDHLSVDDSDIYSLLEGTDDEDEDEDK